jgi:prepilin-type N-terminal cleavage/methylation domain-containing protein/prepilin-type processing-associated H-X9-DG protein
MNGDYELQTAAVPPPMKNPATGDGDPLRRSAFTLVELLVVIAIIGLLIGLLLPAVQATREASRRSSCSNNLKQLALAIQLHHDAKKIFPRSYGDDTQLFDKTTTGKSWIVGILPFYEQQALWNQIDFTAPIGDNTVPAPGNYTKNTYVAATVIPTLLCPSDGGSGNGAMSGRSNVAGTWGVNNYKACAGGNWGWGDHTVTQPSSPWPNDSWGLDHGNGLICRNRHNEPMNDKKMASITDGTSTTFAIGEAVPAWSTHTWWWWFNGTTATCGIPLNYLVENGDAYLVSRADDWVRNYSFFSRHPGGGQFAFVDGSTRFISNSIDLTLYRSLATVGGGESISVP